MIFSNEMNFKKIRSNPKEDENHQKETVEVVFYRQWSDMKKNIHICLIYSVLLVMAVSTSSICAVVNLFQQILSS